MAILGGKPTVDKPLATAKLVDKHNTLSTPNHQKVQERINAALDSREPRNRSSDLVPLTQDFEVLRKNFQRLIEATKAYKDSLSRSDTARMEPIEIFQKMLKHTPFESIADSEMNIQHQVTNKNREYSQRYQREIIDYLVDLESALSTRVDTENKQVQELHTRLMHYENKTQKLRTSEQKKLAKGTTELPKRQAEKLQRNEDKLQRAWKLHEAKASRICDLLEEVTVNGWKDLYHIIGRTFDFEKEYNEDTAKITSELGSLKTQLDTIYREHEVPKPKDPRGIPIALQSEEAKRLHEQEVHYNDEISLSSSSADDDDDDENEVKPTTTTTTGEYHPGTVPVPGTTTGAGGLATNP